MGQLTQRPVPVWVNTLVFAFGPQRGLEIVNVDTVPRQEMTGEMDLNHERVRVSPLICVMFAR